MDELLDFVDPEGEGYISDGSTSTEWEKRQMVMKEPRQDEGYTYPMLMGGGVQCQPRERST